MKTLFKYLKHYYKSILFILLLLILQAICDLSLPTYTSNIINVGISKGGIDRDIPEVLRRSTMQSLTNLMSKEEKEKTLSSFSFVNNKYEKYIKKYPALKDEAIYILNGEHDEKLGDILEKPILLLSMLQNEEMSKMFTEKFPVEENTNLLETIKHLPEEEKEQILSGINQKLEEIPEMFIDSAKTNFIKSEYEQIGMNTEKIQTDYIFTTGAKMLGIALVSMIATVLVGYTGARMAAGLAKRLRTTVFEKVLKFQTSEMKKFGVASLITRSTNDITQIQMMIVMIIRTVIYAPIIGLGALFKVLNTNASMAWIIAVAVGIILVLVLCMFIFVMPKFTKLQKLVDKLNLVAREILTGILPIRAFSNEQHEEKRFDNANRELTKVSLFVNRVMSFMMPLMMIVMNIVTLTIVWYGAKGIDLGTIELGDMMAFIQYTMQIIMAFLMISMVSIMIPRAIVSLKRIDEVIKENILIQDPKEPKKFKKRSKGIVEFKKVSFRYPDADYDVISDISFKAIPGTTTAFIGSTGSGKSTLINLIPRLFDVTTGEIQIDGINIKDVTLHDLHERIGYVPQKGILFSGTILENLQFGNKKLTKKEAQRVVTIAQAKEFIESKKEKYNAKIAQGGTNVSGGQKQRLSIARAIAKNPDIYIFDDSFSALDFKTDKKLRAALKKETKDKTILIVAQRVSTIMNAEQIIVLDEGSIVGIGNHKELMKNCKVYQEIARSQLQEEELNYD